MMEFFSRETARKAQLSGISGQKKRQEAHRSGAF
jgi:hypothetical protein